MDLDLTIFSVLFIFATVITFSVAYLAWRKRSVTGGLDLTWLMIASGIGTFFLIFETAAPTMAQKIFWAKLEFFGGLTTPVFYLMFVFRYIGMEKILSVKNIVWLFTIPAITMALILTNEYHHLFWPGFSEISEKTNLMLYFHGIAFWIGYVAYTYILLLIATLYLIRFIIWHSQTFRTQAWIILIGSLCPWLASVIYLTGANPFPGMDLTPFSMILSGALMVYGILYYGLLDLVPVAREILVETMTDGILVIDGHNRIQDINESALSFFGIQNKNIIGSPADSSVITETGLLLAVTNQQSGSTIEITNDNATKSFRIIKQAIEKQSGSHLIVIHDITDLVAQKMKISAGEERYRNLFTMFRLMADNMPDMLWAKDLHKNFTFVNKATCEILLNTKDTEEPIGKPFQFFADRERLKCPEKADWYTFEGQYYDSDEVVMNTGEMQNFNEYGNVLGSFIYLDVWKAPIFDKDGKMIGIVGSGRDVTIQKQAEAAIYQKNLLLNAITTATALMVQGNVSDESIAEAMDLVSKTIGISRFYILEQLHAEEDATRYMCLRYEWTDGTVTPMINNPDATKISISQFGLTWHESLSSGKTVSGLVSEFPENERAILESRGIKSLLLTPIIVDHALWGVVGMEDCLHEREWMPSEEKILTAAANTVGTFYMGKQRQKELITAKGEAEESERLRSAFLANISHEIRSPMNGIIGFTELLKESDLTGDEKKTYIDIIEESGSHMLTIINNLVDLSRIESGKMEVWFSDVNIGDQIGILYEQFKPEAEDKGIMLSLKYTQPEKKLIVNTDEDKVLAVLTNLLKNAIHFTHQGTVEFGYTEQGENLEFFVRDTGTGIDLDKQKIIFDRFIHANVSHGHAPRGTGLGLAIAKGYVELLGGKIWMESEVGKGSVFYFTIPLSI